MYPSPVLQISASGGRLLVVIEEHFAPDSSSSVVERDVAQHVEASEGSQMSPRQLNEPGFGLSAPVYPVRVSQISASDGRLLVVRESQKAPVVGLINVLNINATKSIVTSFCTIILFEMIRYQRCTVKRYVY